MAYYTLDNPRPTYDYDCAGNITAFDGYTENDYAVDSRRDEGHTRWGNYDDDYIYANWRLEYILLILLMLILTDYMMFCNGGVHLKTS